MDKCAGGNGCAGDCDLVMVLCRYRTLDVRESSSTASSYHGSWITESMTFALFCWPNATL